MSFGAIAIASTAKWDGDFENLVQLSDKNLYKANKMGRNISMGSSLKEKCK